MRARCRRVPFIAVRLQSVVAVAALALAVTAAAAEPGPEVQVGDAHTSYLNPEFSDDGRFMAWSEAPLGAASATLWLCEVDGDTGELVPADGRGLSLGTVQLPAGWPYWGRDAEGTFAVFVGPDGGLVMVRPRDPLAQTLVQALPTPSDPTRQVALPADIPGRAGALIAVRQNDSLGRVQVFLVDTASPGSVVQVTSGPQLAGAGAIFPRWFRGLPEVVFERLDRNDDRFEILMLDADQPIGNDNPRLVTGDPFSHIDDAPFVDNGELYLAGGVDMGEDLAVHRWDPEAGLFRNWATTDLMGSGFLQPGVTNSAEPFKWYGKSWAAFETHEMYGRDPTSFSPWSWPGEIWLVDLPNLSSPRPLTGAGDLVRFEPEVVVSGRHAWVYYNVRQSGSLTIHLWRVDAGLRVPTRRARAHAQPATP